MPNLLTDLVIDRVDLVDEGCNSAAFIEFYKRKEKNMGIEEILAKMAPEQAAIVKAALDASKEAIEKATADVTAQLTASNEALVKAREELETLKKQADADTSDAAKRTDFDEDEVLKAMPERLQAEYRKMKSQKEAAEEAVRKAADERVETLAKAKAAELKALPVPEATLVAVLKGSTPEMVDVLTAVNAALEGVTLSEVGKRGEGVDTSGDSKVAWDAIEKAAEEIAKAENITQQKAIGEVIKRKPELYKAYLDGGAN